LLLLIVLFVVVLEILVRHFSFGYRRSLFYTVFCILFLLVITGFILAQSSLHQGLWERAEANRLPLAGYLYQGMHDRLPRNLHQGIILVVTETGFTMQNIEEQVIFVNINEQTRLPFGSAFMPGDLVMVIGELEDETIEAFGIRKLDNVTLPQNLQPNFPGRPGRHR
jgi:hypothetical protein